jgi:glycerol-3-phosphate dehydrogenase (NAD(P)+)
MNIGVLGAGAWGTALARRLSLNGHRISLWAHRPETLREIEQTCRNEKYLPGIELPANLSFAFDLERLVYGADAILVAVPSRALRGVVGALPSFKGLLISVTKGIEFDSGLTMCGVLEQLAPAAAIAALSGPSFAIEVARDIPTAVVAASTDAGAATQVQQLFAHPCFRVYTSTDQLGVELGGALKNVIAIAAGINDGLGFGDNSKAALVTRAIVEMRRLGEACGAQGETFTGLSGLGDLMVTCFSRHSRNRGFGERVGRGEKPEEIVQKMQAVAEGYPTARSAYHLAKKLHVQTPVIDEVYGMLYEGKDASRSVRDLMTRDLKAE